MINGEGLISDFTDICVGGALRAHKNIKTLCFNLLFRSRNDKNIKTNSEMQYDKMRVERVRGGRRIARRFGFVLDSESSGVVEILELGF